jgi:hypothetical protein
VARLVDTVLDDVDRGTVQRQVAAGHQRFRRLRLVAVAQGGDALAVVAVEQGIVVGHILRGIGRRARVEHVVLLRQCQLVGGAEELRELVQAATACGRRVRQHGVIGLGDVVAVAPGGVGQQIEATEAAEHGGALLALAAGGFVAEFQPAAERLALVEKIRGVARGHADDAAKRIRAPDGRGRTAQDVDGLEQVRIEHEIGAVRAVEILPSAIDVERDAGAADATDADETRARPRATGDVDRHDAFQRLGKIRGAAVLDVGRSQARNRLRRRECPARRAGCGGGDGIETGRVRLRSGCGLVFGAQRIDCDGVDGRGFVGLGRFDERLPGQHRGLKNHRNGQGPQPIPGHTCSCGSVWPLALAGGPEI